MRISNGRGARRARLGGWAVAALGVLPALAIGLFSSRAGSQTVVEVVDALPSISSLKNVKPLAADVSDYIRDKTAAQKLGKALFWDIQVGSSGVACASCHFHAGADIRTKNQVSPGLNAGDTAFSAHFLMFGRTGPNKEALPLDFPAHRLLDPRDRESIVLYDSNDVVSSQGSFGGTFVSSNRTAAQVTTTGVKAAKTSSLPTNETCNFTYTESEPFHENGLIYRRVEPRNTPTSVNAVFNYRQFWDGRANSQFNGVNPFGPRAFQPVVNGVGNKAAKSTGTLVASSTGSLKLEQRLIDNSSLASQAVGPPLSGFEMSCESKTFADLGRKMIPLKALGAQKVLTNDSVLGSLSAGTAPGLNTTYEALIKAAFWPKYWANVDKVAVNDDGSVSPSASGYTQMEQNFSLFWGLAIQEYEALLISDDSAFDRSKNGTPSAMTYAAQQGEKLFTGKGKCVNCHHGALFSGATVTSSDSSTPKVLEHMRIGSGATAFYDNGFYNIGVRPTKEDGGVGGKDPYGFDLSFSRQYKWRQLGVSARAPDKFSSHPCSWEIQYVPCTTEPTWTEKSATERDAVDGAFKTPILRNVGLNPPYFHNGGQATLKDVVRFYNRGGDRRGPLDADTTGLATPNEFGQVNKTNLDPDIGDASNVSRNNALGLTELEMDYLVAFLLSLTDERVACHAGVFDHPELPLSMGHAEAAQTGSQLAQDVVKTLPATGSTGFKGIGKTCFPNTGDLFGSINLSDLRPLQLHFNSILGTPTAAHLKFFPKLRVLQ
jgi:cytochrome c peroxidase